ncbi:sugar phosphate isomerase/epimerase family protein [Actinomycetota bacterium]
MVIGISTLVFGEEKRLLTLEEVKIIAETGMKYFELSDSHDVNSGILNVLKQNGIGIFSIHAEYLGADLSGADQDKRIKGIDYAKKGIDKIKRLGGNIIVIHPGGWYGDKKEEENRLKNCINSLVEITEYGNSKKIKVAIENLPPGFLGDKPGVLKTILSEVRSITGLNKEIGICLDTGHALLTGNLFEYLELFSDDIINMHLHDNIGNSNRDKLLALDDIHRPPGHGLINWEKFFKRLYEIKYDGSLMFELKSDSIEGKDWKYVLNKALKFVESEDFFTGGKILQTRS